MGARTWDSVPEEPPPPRRGPGVPAAVLTALVVLALLLANGRPIGRGGGGPGLAGHLDRPFVAAAGALVAMDEPARALCGKLAAAAFAALAAAFLFAAVGHRRPTGEAGASAFLLALGSSLWAASQSLSAQPPGAAAVALAVLFLARAEDEPVWAGRAGLPLSLAVALLPAAAAPALVILLAVGVRWPLQGLLLLLWAVPGLLLLAGQMGPGAPAAFGPVAPPDADALGLLVSPARGALVFTPVAFVAAIGLVRGLGRDRWLAGTLGVAFLAHTLWVLLGPDGGPSWGTLALTAAWPLLFLFLPEGMDATRYAGGLVAVVSVAVQAMGAFGYDGRWDRLHRDPAGRIAPGARWDVAESPIALQIRERVLRLAVPALVDRRLLIREHPMVVGGPTGSRVSFAGPVPLVTGADSTLGDVFLEGGARVVLDKLELRAAADGLFLRVRDGARPRRLELRVAGRGRGTLAVAEGGFWNPAPRVTTHPVDGEFRVRRPYFYPESGGPDLRLTVRAGSLQIRSVALVPPGEPESVIQLGGAPGSFARPRRASERMIRFRAIKRYL